MGRLVTPHLVRLHLRSLRSTPALCKQTKKLRERGSWKQPYTIGSGLRASLTTTTVNYFVWQLVGRHGADPAAPWWLFRRGQESDNNNSGSPQCVTRYNPNAMFALAAGMFNRVDCLSKSCVGSRAEFFLEFIAKAFQLDY